MVADVIQMRTSVHGLDRYRRLKTRSRREAAPGSPDPEIVRELVEAGMIEARPIPLPRHSDRGPPIRHWKENLPAAFEVLRRHSTLVDSSEEERRAREAHQRRFDRIYGHSIFPQW